MVKCKSTTRLSSIKKVQLKQHIQEHSSGYAALTSPIILTQTDTTVGFLSQNSKKLYEIKERSTTKPFIKVFNNLSTSTCRVPKKYKNLVRRSKKTTFIINNQAFRIALPTINSQILRDSTWNYSTSANKSKDSFNRDFCENKADIIIEDICGLREKKSSSLIKLNHKKRKKLR